ncbi:MAG: class I SAM-dependent methyltransferase [Bacteroidia bacterium]|nr:class I SAM-dependent methyltransferase [Bacteroidia bacterium]
MRISDKLLGNNREHIPNRAFRLMAFVMKVMDIMGYYDKNFKTLGLQKGQTVIDYGCGPARYTLRIAKAIGKNGQLIATDIHPLAIKRVARKIKKYGLSNTKAVLSKGYSCPLNEHIADVVLALDMFHMIQDTNALLKEFARLVKPSGVVIIEDGHQPREQTKAKIISSGFFKIIEETKEHVKCKVLNNNFKN